MPSTSQSFLPRLGMLCRVVAVTVIAVFYRKLSIKQINARVKAQPLARQAVITGLVLLALFGLSLFAAQFGWIG
ncbi:MAG: hypothetical protein AAGG54_00735, partial [Pseudomonadota bacterium]